MCHVYFRLKTEWFGWEIFTGIQMKCGCLETGFWHRSDDPNPRRIQQQFAVMFSFLSRSRREGDKELEIAGTKTTFTGWVTLSALQKRSTSRRPTEWDQKNKSERGNHQNREILSFSSSGLSDLSGYPRDRCDIAIRRRSLVVFVFSVHPLLYWVYWKYSLIQSLGRQLLVCYELDVRFWFLLSFEW